MAQTDSILNLGASGGDNVVKTLDKAKKGLEGIGNEAAKLKKGGNIVDAALGNEKQRQAGLKSLDALKKSLAEQEQLLVRVNKAFNHPKSVDSLVLLKKKSDELKTSIGDLKTQIEAADTGFDDMGKGLSGGQTRKLFSTLAQSLGGYGGFGAGAGGAGIGEALGLPKEAQQTIAQFGQTLQEVTPFLQEASDEFGTIGKNVVGMLKGTTSASEGLGNVASGLGSVGVIGALVGATLAVWGKVFQMVGDEAQKAKENVDKYVEAARKKIELDRQIADFTATGDLGGAQAALETAKKAREDANALVADLQSQIAANEQEYAQLGSTFDPITRHNLAAAHDELQQQLTDVITNDLGPAVQQVGALMSALPDIANVDPVIQRLGNLMGQMPQDANAVENLKSAEQDLIQTRQNAADVAKAFQQQIEQMGQENAVQARREFEDRYIADARAARDHADEMAKIQADGDKQIESLQKDHTKTMVDLQVNYAKESQNAAVQLAKNLLQIDTGLAKDIAKATKQYQQDQVKAGEQFHKDQSRAEAEYQKERKRRLEDAQQALLDAEMNNDVVAFLQAKQSAKTDLSRMDEDRADARRQAQEDFAQQREEARQSLQQQIADMKEAAVEQRQQAQDSYKEEKAQRDQQFAEQKQQEQMAFDDRLAQQREQTRTQLQESAAAYAKQEELQAQDRRLQDDRRAEDQARQLKQLTDGFRDQMAAARKHETDLLNVIESGGNAQLTTVTLAQTQLVSAYETGAINAVNAINAAMSRIGPGYNSAYSPAVGPMITGAAKGIVTTRPTLVAMSEYGQPEMVLPMTPSGGLPGGVGGSTVNFRDIIIGAGNSVTHAEVSEALERLADRIAGSIEGATRP